MANTDNQPDRQFTGIERVAVIFGIREAINVLTDYLEFLEAPEGLPAVKHATAAATKRAAGLLARLTEGDDGLTLRGTPRKMHPRDPRHPGHAKWVRKIAKGKAKAMRARQAGGAAKPAKAASGYWGKMTAEERSAEMQRRVNKRKTKSPKVSLAA